MTQDEMYDELRRQSAQNADLLAEYVKAKIQGMHILNQNGANLVYNHGKDVAKKLGLDDDHMKGITPFPSNTKIVMNTEAPMQPEKQQTESPSLIRKALPYVAAALLGGGIPTAAMLAGEYFTDDKPDPVEQEQDPSSVGVTVE